MHRWNRLVIVLWAGITLPTHLFGTDLKPRARMEIIRSLTAEYATLKVPLPRGKKGLVFNANGQADSTSSKHEFTQYGTALRPSTVVQITQLFIEDKQIVFEINGGGAHKSKWYEHVELGVGNNTAPLAQGETKTPTGSSITLVFPQKIHDLSVEQLKEYLSPVLDFNPSTAMQAFIHPIPEKFKHAVEDKKAAVGMDRDTVMAALGPPLRKVREDKDGVEREDWIYGAPPLKMTFVSFEEDEVVEVKDYEGGIGGAVQVSSEADDPIPH